MLTGEIGLVEGFRFHGPTVLLAPIHTMLRFAQHCYAEKATGEQLDKYTRLGRYLKTGKM